MDWSAIPLPLISAAAGLAGALLGSGISAWTTRRTHAERLSADRDLADRKFNFDCQLAEKKAGVDAAMAEKKLAFDRALAAWKRRAEFAEDVLADFYEAVEIIRAARSPATFGGEGETRKKESWENDEDARILNWYYATAERLMVKNEFFSQLFSRRYRSLALFGQIASKPYHDLFGIRHEILIAVRQLVKTHRYSERGSLPQSRQHWEEIVWDAQGENDPVNMRLNAVIESIEKICRSAVQEIGEQQA